MPEEETRRKQTASARATDGCVLRREGNMQRRWGGWLFAFVVSVVVCVVTYSLTEVLVAGIYIASRNQFG